MTIEEAVEEVRMTIEYLEDSGASSHRIHALRQAFAKIRDLMNYTIHQGAG